MYDPTIPRMRTTLHSVMSFQGIWGVVMEGLLLEGGWQFKFEFEFEFEAASEEGRGKSATHSIHTPLESSIV